MGATDGNLTVTFSGTVVSFGLAGDLVVLDEEDGEDESTVEADPSSAEDEPSPNNPLSFPAKVISDSLSTRAAIWRVHTRERIILHLSIRNSLGHRHKTRFGKQNGHFDDWVDTTRLCYTR
jgi:hypothetical protein